MPFTASHAAAVLPLLRTPLPASALVIGSIAPDLPYYLPVPLPWATHTALAVGTVDVLLGGLAWALWTLILLGLPVITWLDQLLRQAGRPRKGPGLLPKDAGCRGPS